MNMEETEKVYEVAVKIPINERGRTTFGAIRVNDDIYEINLSPGSLEGAKWTQFSLSSLLEMAAVDGYDAQPNIPAGNFITVNVSIPPVIGGCTIKR